MLHSLLWLPHSMRRMSAVKVLLPSTPPRNTPGSSKDTGNRLLAGIHRFLWSMRRDQRCSTGIFHMSWIWSTHKLTILFLYGTRASILPTYIYFFNGSNEWINTQNAKLGWVWTVGIAVLIFYFSSVLMCAFWGGTYLKLQIKAITELGAKYKQLRFWMLNRESLRNAEFLLKNRLVSQLNFENRIIFKCIWGV